MKISVIVCAAGKGTRAGLGKNKLLAPVYGAPVIYHTVKKFYDAGLREIIVTSTPEDMAEMMAITASFNTKVIVGGQTRSESVYKALKAVTGDIVLIHDGARPYVTQKIINDCIESVNQYRSGICSLPSTDTTVIAADGVIKNIPNRAKLFTLQTPQGFFTEDIRKAYECAFNDNKIFTDDSSVYCEYIGQAHLFTGHICNKKLTYRSDFDGKYPALNAARVQAAGIGADVHAFGKEQDHVTLCGVQIPCDSGLIAHSDGDVAVHAIMDAILAAAGLKDIGHYFPETDEKYAGADSMELLKEVVKLALNEGYVPLNLSLTIQAEKPRLYNYIDKMVENIANAVNLPKRNIAISAGTCEKLGFVGEGLGISATAIALCEKKSQLKYIW